MRYAWKCRHCGHVLSVYRSIKDYQVPPHGDEAMHPRCSRLQFKRVIEPPTIVVHESENDYWRDV